VAFAKDFPTTVWLWRRRTSRLARRIALFFFLALALLAIGLRVNSAIFVHRVHRILAGMEQLRPDQTTKAEMLKMVPALRAAGGAYVPLSGMYAVTAISKGRIHSIMRHVWSARRSLAKANPGAVAQANPIRPRYPK
jgi:hypothetical protein